MSADDKPDPSSQNPDTPYLKRPDGGWGAVGGMLKAFGKQDASLATIGALENLNKPGGVMCSSCAASPSLPSMQWRNRRCGNSNGYRVGERRALCCCWGLRRFLWSAGP